MKVKINDQEIELVYSMRAFVIYENIAGDSLDFSNFKSLKQLTTTFLAFVYASAQKQGININWTYDDYMNWLDDNNGYTILNEFALWLADQIQAQFNLLPKTEDDDKKDKTVKHSKKKV